MLTFAPVLKELAEVGRELHEKRLQICRRQQEVQEERDRRRELDDLLRAARLAHAGEVRLCVCVCVCVPRLCSHLCRHVGHTSKGILLTPRGV